MSNKTQIYCNNDNYYNYYYLKKLWQDLATLTNKLKEKELEIDELISRGLNRTAIQLVKIGRLKIKVIYLKNEIDTIYGAIKHFSKDLIIY